MIELQRHRTELNRAIQNFHYERTPSGVYIEKAGIFLGGVFRTWVNGRDEQVDPNVVLYDGIDDILKVYFAQAAQRTAFYVVPFSNDVDPPPDLKATDFPATMGEFTHYTETTRPVWAKGAVSGQSISNTATPAQFTSDATGGTVWGAALTTASGKQATSGLMVCCARFSRQRDLAGTGDKLSIEYAFVGRDGTPP